MRGERTERRAARGEFERIVGRIVGDPPGPTVIAMSGMHGNEPAGIEAAERVLARLAARGVRPCGRFVALAGNLAALRERTRFIDRDLNRQWTPENVREALAPTRDAPASVESIQMRELIDVLRAEVDGGGGPIYFLDLHTSSADGPPFVTVGDTLRNRRFARGFPLPLILGLEEQIDGALLEYLNNFGLITLGVEAGQHGSERAVERHEAVLWLSLVHAGVIPREAVPDYDGRIATLREASLGVPRIVEVLQRHPIPPGTAFTMEPGFSNFATVRCGQLLAHDDRGPVRAGRDALLLLPLYQGKGDDGFFLAREVRPFWLSVSALARQARLGAWMRFLPGVRRLDGREETLLVDTRVARYYPLEIFHLLGYRKRRQCGDALVVSRRRHDLEPPPRPRVAPELG